MDADFLTFQQLLNATKTEDGVFAEFYDQPEKTDQVQANGLPIFKETTFVRIRTRDNSDVYDQPANDKDIHRFPVEYSRYLLAKKEIKDGTPLNQFAFLTAAQLETCTSRGVFTVERLAELSDEHTKDLNLEKERSLAQKFIAVSKNNGNIAEFEVKEQAYQKEIEKLKAEIQKLKDKKKDE